MYRVDMKNIGFLREVNIMHTLVLSTTELFSILLFIMSVKYTSTTVTYGTEEESSGEIIVQPLSRDLICYQCSGNMCPAQKYISPIRHLIVQCNACYKEWDLGG